MKPRRIDRLPWRKIDDHVIIIHPAGGQVHELNPVGACLWESADGSRTPQELAEKLALEFEVTEADALTDTQEFFQQLDQAGLIAWNAD